MPQTIHIRTTWGVITVHFVDHGVTACRLPPLQTRPAQPLRVLGVAADGPIKPGRQVHRIVQYIVGALRGAAPKAPPVVWPPDATAFQMAVWRALRRIPKGRCRTYGEVARAVGSPRSARAVGQACGANPLPLFIPCHRVVAGAGRLGGFSSGAPWKQWLLAQEHAG